VDLSAASADLERFSGRGHTVMAVAADGVLCGVLAVADTLKKDSAEAVARLHGLGLEVVMLTGDNPRTARAIADEVNIERFVADVRPDEKAQVIRDLKAEGKKVAMVGDGINDAPALAVADVGMAIGTGTDVAMEAGGVVLVSGSLSGVPRAVELARATMRTIRFNLFWAFCYNVVLIPVAAGVLAPVSGVPGFLRRLHPMLAALAMAFSSISVVTNSLRLYRKRIL